MSTVDPVDELAAALAAGASIEALETYAPTAATGASIEVLETYGMYVRIIVRPKNSSRTFTAMVRILSATEV